MIVYKITHKYNGDSYIGQTIKTVEQRWITHIHNAFNEHSHMYNSYLQRAIRKYGPDAFEIEALHICESKEEMDLAEIFYIAFLNTKRPNGYNLTDGGGGVVGFKHSEETCKLRSIARMGRKLSDETKKKLSDAGKGHPGYWTGKKHSEEHKKKVSEALKGRKFSDETLERMSKMAKQRGLKLQGKHLSEEVRNKISEGGKLRWAKFKKLSKEE